MKKLITKKRLASWFWSPNFSNGTVFFMLKEVLARFTVPKWKEVFQRLRNTSKGVRYHFKKRGIIFRYMLEVIMTLGRNYLGRLM